jgi:hypothetical protein
MLPEKTQLGHEVRRSNAIREMLLAEHGDDIDEQTLADTTEGLTSLHELLAAIVRGALDDEATVEMIKRRMADLADRAKRFDARAERRRSIVRDAMADAHIKKLTPPDFTASLAKAQPHVVVVDEALIPPPFWEQRPHLLKREILARLKEGAEVAGTTLSNPAMALTVRTK